jgi:hypothetical protein
VLLPALLLMVVLLWLAPVVLLLLLLLVLQLRPLHACKGLLLQGHLQQLLLVLSLLPGLACCCPTQPESMVEPWTACADVGVASRLAPS